MKYEVLNRGFVCRELPTAMCHGTTVLPSKDSDIVLSAWFGGSYEGEDDTSIYLSAFDGYRWSTPMVMTPQNEPHWNPVLCDLGNNQIALYYKIGRKIASWRTMVRYSSDGGNTWSEAKELVNGDEGGRGPVRCKVIRLSNGDLLAPASSELAVNRAFADRSCDNGRTWQKSNIIEIKNLSQNADFADTAREIEVSEQSFKGRGVIQPTLWESTPGIVHMLLRSSEKRIFRSDSEDYGKSWCDAYPTQLPGNNSGIDLALTNDKRAIVLAYNPVAANWGSRTPLSLATSTDNGATWEHLMDLETGEGEFSYPAIVSQNDIFHITYTWKRKAIAYWQIKIQI